MILLIDNYDSFSYNLAQMIGDIQRKKKQDGEEVKVVRNDEITVDQIKELNPSHIILSPGPGRPKEAGICEELIKSLYKKVRILGVCLGHQAICEAFGGEITYAKELMHGKQSKVSIVKSSVLFEGLENKQIVARYHSLVAKEDGMSEELEVTAVDKDGQIMAVQHSRYGVYGVQFHPESILTPNGERILANFLSE